MEQLNNFLNDRRVTNKNEAYNLVSMLGGKWNITPESREEFFKLYSKSVISQNKKYTAFVY